MYDVKNKYTPAFLREMPPQELELLAGEAADSLFVLRHQASCGGHSRTSVITEQPHLRKKIKRDIARIKTIIGEK